MTTDCTSQAFFEAKYQRDLDPWSFASSPAELFRYDRILHALRKRRYRKAFEPACSVGVLTQRLATVCDYVEAFDLSHTAVTRARERCSGLLNVDIRCASLEDHAPSVDADLLVLSEVGYYFSPEEWEFLLTKLLRALQPGGTVIAAHWLGSSNDHRISGDEVHRIVRANSLLVLEYEERHEQFRLDRLERV